MLTSRSLAISPSRYFDHAALLVDLPWLHRRHFGESRLKSGVILSDILFFCAADARPQMDRRTAANQRLPIEEVIRTMFFSFSG